MKPKLIPLACLSLMAGMLLTAALVGPAASLAAGPPPTETPQGATKTPHTYPPDPAQAAGKQVSDGRMHVDSLDLLPPSVHPVGPTSNGAGWQRIEWQDFEGMFLISPLWRSLGNMADDGLIYYWGNRDCRALSGSYSAWAIGFSSGGDPACGMTYPNNLTNHLVYGPFDLSQATDAELQFSLWADIEGDGANLVDSVRWGASTDGMNFGGNLTAGQTGNWVPESLNLTNVPEGLGDLTGQPEVYAAWTFHSNESNPTDYKGAFVDDAALWVYEPPLPLPPPPTPTLPITVHTTITDFMRGRSHDASVSIGNQEDGALVPSAQMIAIGDWERLPSLPRKLLNFAAVTAKGHLFIIGGNSPDTAFERRVYSALIQDDGLLGRWIEVTQLPQALTRHTAVVANDHLFVLGGFNNNGVQATVFSTQINDDGTLGEWTMLSALPDPLERHAAVAAHGYIYILGGRKSIDPMIVSDKVYRARIGGNGTLDEWETLPGPLPMPCMWHAAVATCNHLYLIGGADALEERNHVLRAAIQADGDLGTWSQTAPLPKALIVPAATAVRGGILVTGGWNSLDPVFSSQRSVYWGLLTPDCSLDSWIALTPLPYHTNDHALAATDRYIYNLGGGNAAPRYFASVLMSPLQLDDSSVRQGIFNHQFHLGSNYTIESLRWTEEGSGDTDISLRYRVGNAHTGEYGPWSDYASTGPIPVNATGGYLEYQLKFEGGSGLSDKHITEVSLSITPLGSVYLPLVIKD